MDQTTDWQVSGWWTLMVDALRQDVPYAFRILRKNPGVTAVALFTLSLAIGAVAAIFSIVEATLLRPLPIEDPDRVVVLHDQLPKLGVTHGGVSPLQFREYGGHRDVFESSALVIERNLNLTVADQPRRVLALRSSFNLFSLLGVRPVLGRTFTEEEDTYGSGYVTLLSEGLWREMYGSAAEAIGKSVALDSENYRIVGVMPADLSALYPNVQLWIPLRLSPRLFTEDERWTITYTMLARLRGSATIESARVALAREAAKVTDNVPPEHAGKVAGFSIDARTFASEQTGNIRQPLYILLGAVLFVFLIACANVANLLLARNLERSHEIAVRAALGGTRQRIVRQLLTESVCLSVLAGACGTLLAFLAVDIFARAAPASVPHAARARLDLVVLTGTVVLSLLAGTLSGLVPALQAARTNLVESIKGTDLRAGSRRGGIGVRQVFICSEVALTCILLVCASLLGRTVVKLLDVDLGFRSDHLLTLRLASSTRVNPADAPASSRAVLQEVLGVPGVVNAAYASEPPLMDTGSALIAIRDYPSGGGHPQPHSDIVNTSPSYFATMSIPLLRGRLYNDSDMAGGNAVVLVDETFARKFWPADEPVGKQLAVNRKAGWSTVVGVVGTVRTRALAAPSEGTVYFPAAFTGMSLVVRTASDPRAAVTSIRQRLQAIAGKQAIYDVRTMDERVLDSVGQHRFAGTVLTTFAVLALIFAAVGLFSVTSDSVSLRIREIGIRMALGAQRRDILQLVLAQGLRTALAGVVIGVLAALGLTRLLANLLFGIDAADPTTYAAVVVLLSVVVTIACYIPASRAATVDSAETLRP